MNKQYGSTFKEIDSYVAVWGCLRGTEAVIDEAGRKNKIGIFLRMHML